MCWIRHWRRTWGNLTKYNVGRWLENDLEEEPDGMHKEKPQTSSEAFLCGIRQRPTLPGRLQPSTIGAERLNFCVRYGNRWIPFAIVTGNRIGFFAYPENRTSRFLTSRITSFQFSLWSQLNSFRSSPRPISIIRLQMLPLFHR